MRLLALALLAGGKADEGVALMALAYEGDTSLALRSMDDGVLGTPRALRDRLNRTVTYAGKVGSASAWLTVAVLMQAEGREETAQKMIDRAQAAGLNAQVAADMELALR